MSDEKNTEKSTDQNTDAVEPDPLEATTEADVSDGAEQKQKPVDPPVIDEVR